MKERFTAIFKSKTRDEWTAHLRRDRRLRGAGAVALGGARAPAQRGPLDLHRGRRRRAAGPRAPLLPHAVGRVEAAVAAGSRHGVGARANGAWTRGIVAKLRESGALS